MEKMIIQGKNETVFLSRSKRVLFQLFLGLAVLIALAISAFIWRPDLITRIYLTDKMNMVLNGITLVLFLTGITQLIRCFLHYSFEEKQIAIFVQGKEEEDRYLFHRLSPKSIISDRYFTVKTLYEKRVPINHAAMSSIMVATESIFPSFPRFVNNVLILTGVFGTIIGLILALVGGSSVLETAVPGEGIGIMLQGMKTAGTTTATAITCFFFFTYFYHKLLDIQTSLFGKVEHAVMTYIVPEFAFDSETVNYKTEHLVRELRELVGQLKEGASVLIQRSEEGPEKTGINQLDAGLAHINEKMDAYIARQDSHLEKMGSLIGQVENVNALLKEGFRLNSFKTGA